MIAAMINAALSFPPKGASIPGGHGCDMRRPGSPAYRWVARARGPRKDCPAWGSGGSGEKGGLVTSGREPNTTDLSSCRDLVKLSVLSPNGSWQTPDSTRTFESNTTRRAFRIRLGRGMNGKKHPGGFVRELWDQVQIW